MVSRHFPYFSNNFAGDTLVPFLFILAVDYIMCVSVDKISNGFLLERSLGPRNPATYITDTDFADIALISSPIEEAQKLLMALELAKTVSVLP